MGLELAIFLAVLFLAYSNGANDNFKGVATLFGSRTTNYKIALAWATLTTFLGSIAAVFFAETLVKNFSGKGLVPDSITSSPEFLLAVAIGAGLTVIFATVIGFPISTTHSLIGALVGSGLVAAGSTLNLSILGSVFLLPLLTSPFIALTSCTLVYLAFKRIRISLGVTKEKCICIGKSNKFIPISQGASVLSVDASAGFESVVDYEENCIERYTGKIFGINCQDALDGAHYLSAGLVSFARGLNDTPKIAAILLVVSAFNLKWGFAAIGLGMAIGGILSAKKVAEKMSHGITTLNHGQGFTANMITGLIVIIASQLGVPVSTTHVSVGSLFGIGLVSGNADKKVISGILMSWLLTLPIAALCSATACWFIY